MARRHTRGRALRSWRQKRDISLADLARRIDDSPSGQLSKFETGERDLPFPLASALSKETGISLERLLSKEQFDLAQNIFALMARDAAA